MLHQFDLISIFQVFTAMVSFFFPNKTLNNLQFVEHSLENYDQVKKILIYFGKSG